MNRPEILSMPNIPRPLHGLNPRTIMGQSAWDDYRRGVYASTGHCCAACGVHKSQAQKFQRMEAHELFNVEYSKRTATLVDIVPLCHYCHAFIHSGLTRIRARNKQITANEVRAIMRHGVSLLQSCGADIFEGTAILCDLAGVTYDGVKVSEPVDDFGAWSEWKMVWGDKIYPARFTSQRQWEAHYGG